MRGAAERAAEALEAEVAAVVASDRIVISVGFPADEVPVSELGAVAEGRSETIPVPGAGPRPAIAVPLVDPVVGHLVLARSGEGFDKEELSLLRGMAQVLALSVRTLRVLERERELHEQNKQRTQAELERLARAALTDNLTDLRNLRAFQEDLDRELHRRMRSFRPLALVMFDLDDLKEVNDTLGHQAGDERLQRLGGCLLETARASDGVYRVGGDEFAAILAGETSWGALRFVQRVQETLASITGAAPVTVTAGVAEAGSSTTKEALIRNADLALLEAKRSHRGAVIYSAGLEPLTPQPDRRAEQRHLQTLATALARAVDAKDPYTRSHSETVSETCGLIGVKLGLAAERLAKIRLAGLLHDVGKIGIPDAILHKPGPLTEDEFKVMKTHSALGHRIVRGAGLEVEANWILHHHERIDGRGYPDGLAGEAVPLESRIILVADAFEAITSDRPYRAGRPESEALAELERHAGTQFDPDCVFALRQALGTDATSPAAGHRVASVA